MRLVIIIDDSNIEQMWYDNKTAEGMSVNAMSDEAGVRYTEVVIGRDHPLFNFKQIHDICSIYHPIMFKSMHESEQFFEDLQNIIFKLI